VYQAPFGWANLAKLLALNTRDDLRPIWVKDKTLTVTNGHVLIRSQHDVPDGLYQLGLGGVLELLTPQPDDYPELQITGFENRVVSSATPFGTLTRESRSEIALRASALLEIEEKEMWLPEFANTWVNPKYVVIALTELSRYGDTKVLRAPAEDAPVLIGLNWGQCCLVMPIRKEPLSNDPS